jgi:predicted nucleic-acid-binding Zn-ribbon protein
MAKATKQKSFKLDPEKAEAWLNEHWKGVRACPICGNSDWLGNDEAMEVRSFEAGRLAATGPVIPLLTLTCSTCGNTLFFNGILAGLVEQPESE